MNNPELAQSPVDPRWQPNAQRIAMVRVFGDLGLWMATFYFVGDTIGTIVGNIIIAGATVILLTSITGYFLIRMGRTNLGLGALIGGMLSGLVIISVVIEGVGIFFLFLAMLFTTLSVATTMPQRLAVQFILTSVASGLIGLLIDIFLGPGGNRLPWPAELTTGIWIISGVMTIISGIIIQRQFENFGLRTKLVTSFVIVTVLALGLLGYLNDRNTRAVLTSEANEALFAAASQTEDSIDDFLIINRDSIGTESTLPGFKAYLKLSSDTRAGTPEEAQVREMLTALAGKDLTYISSYSLINRDGIVLVDTESADIGTNKSGQEYFIQAVKTGEAYISDVSFSQRAGTPSIYFSAPIKDSNSRSLGVLRVRYDAAILQNLVERNNDLVGEDSFGVLFDENFLHLAHGTAPETLFTSLTLLDTETLSNLTANRRVPSLSAEEISLDLPDLEENLLMVANRDHLVDYFAAEDVATGERLNQAVVIPFHIKPWVLVFFQPQDVFLAPVESQTKTIILLVVLIAGIVVALAFGLAQAITNPITQLTNIAKNVSEGNLSVRSDIDTDDEIGTLAKTFNSMTSQLFSMITGLEDAVAERTQDLERRASYLLASANVAREATGEELLGDMINKAVNLTRSYFDFYYVGLFLVDNQMEYAVLADATEDAGQLLLDTQHKIKIGSDSAVGYVTKTGEPQIASEDESTPDIFRHPILQDTKLQIVLPLKVDDEILGAFDIHVSDESSVDENELPLFQTLADQLAISIQKKRYLEEIEQTHTELETAYGRYTRSAWDAFSKNSKRAYGYRFNQFGIDTVEEQGSDAKEAWLRNKTIIKVNDLENTSTIAIPLLVRGEVMGVIHLQLSEKEIPKDTQEFVEEIGERLGLVLENARLLEASQQKVERERVLREITGRMRESLDIDRVLQIAVQEIGSKFGISDVEVRLGSNSSIDKTNGSRQKKTNASGSSKTE